jgi:hypothetical protein
MEKGSPNGHTNPSLPLKRVLIRNIPELKPELDPVINAFDPWARDRGQYYSLQWKPRPGAESDPAPFKQYRTRSSADQRTSRLNPLRRPPGPEAANLEKVETSIPATFLATALL